MRMTLEAQVAATAVSIILLVDTSEPLWVGESAYTSAVMPENLLGITILVFQSKVYVLGLFYSLNSRTSTSNVHTITMDTTHPVGTCCRPMGGCADSQMAFSEAQAATIHVDHETEMHVLVSSATIHGGWLVQVGPGLMAEHPAASVQAEPPRLWREQARRGQRDKEPEQWHRVFGAQQHPQQGQLCGVGSSHNTKPTATPICERPRH